MEGADGKIMIKKEYEYRGESKQKKQGTLELKALSMAYGVIFQNAVAPAPASFKNGFNEWIMLFFPRQNVLSLV